MIIDIILTECEDEEFKCDNGDCIKNSLTCDGVPHCDNNEDEKIVCGNYLMQCYNFIRGRPFTNQGGEVFLLLKQSNFFFRRWKHFIFFFCPLNQIIFFDKNWKQIIFFNKNWKQIIFLPLLLP